MRFPAFRLENRGLHRLANGYVSGHGIDRGAIPARRTLRRDRNVCEASESSAIGPRAEAGLDSRMANPERLRTLGAVARAFARISAHAVLAPFHDGT